MYLVVFFNVSEFVMVRGKIVMIVTFYEIFEIKMSWLVFLSRTMTFFHDFENLVFAQRYRIFLFPRQSLNLHTF